MTGAASTGASGGKEKEPARRPRHGTHARRAAPATPAAPPPQPSPSKPGPPQPPTPPPSAPSAAAPAPTPPPFAAQPPLSFLVRPSPTPPPKPSSLHTSETLHNLRRSASRVGWTVVVWALFALFVLGPLLTVVAFSLTPSIFRGVAPTTLHWYASLFSQAELFLPLLRSFEVATLVVIVQLAFGTLIAYTTARRRIHGAPLMDAMSNLTIALPSVVVGLALLSFYGPFGPVHALSDLIFSRPTTFTWTLWIVVFAHVLETFPYMVRTVGTVLQQIPPNLEMAARSLGAGRFTVFRTIVLPLVKPGLLAGGVLVFSRSVAEFGATIVVVSAVLRTSPIAIYSQAESGSLELASAYSVVLMLVSFAVYLVMRRRILRTGLRID